MRKFSIAAAAMIALASLQSTGMSATSAEFKDVPDTSPYFAYIHDLKTLGITDGIAEGVYGPKQTLTRAQFAKFVTVAFQLKDQGGPAPFPDIRDRWAAAYIRAAYQAGIVNGTSDTTFSPNEPVKREEASVMVRRFAKKQGLTSGSPLNFSDKPDTWAAEGISGIIAHGWYDSDVTQDSGVWSYRPQDTITREEAAALIGLSIKEVPGQPVGGRGARANDAGTRSSPRRRCTPGHRGTRAVGAGTCSSPGSRGPRAVGASTCCTPGSRGARTVGAGTSAPPAAVAPVPMAPAPTAPPATGEAIPTPVMPPAVPAGDVTSGLPSGSVPYGSMAILSASKPGATIYYTTDGSDPRTSSTRKPYTSPIPVLGGLQLKTCAVYHPSSEKTEVSGVSVYEYEVGSVSPPGPSVGLYDPLESFKLMTSRTNMYIATDHPAYFGNDAKRMARTSTAPGSIVYHMEYDIVSVLFYNYFFTGIELEKSKMFASADGKTYQEIPVKTYPVGYPSGDWQQYAYEASSLPAGMRYLKIEQLGAAKSWSPQLSRVSINRSTASVDVKSTRNAESLQVELSSATQGARIYYRKDNAPAFQLYTGPFQLTGYSVIETYAVKDSLEPSPIRKTKLNGSSDILVDRFGQIVAADFPEKVTSEQELEADVQADASYYGSLKPPTDLDRYGGLAGSAAKYGLKGTGYFAIQQLNGRKVMKTPSGDIFFSLGMNGITPHETYTMVKSREQQFESLPPYEGTYQPAFISADHSSFSFYMANKYRKTGTFPTESSFYTEAVGRLKKWGFNSAGGYSPEKFGNVNQFPYTRMLPLDIESAKLDGISIFDIFAPDAEAKMDEAFAKALPPNKNDPMLIGYFIGNEYDFHKFYSNVPKLKASSAAIKGRLVKMMKDKYQTIDMFNRNWGTSFTSFNDLLEAELPVKTSQSWADMDMFFRYYLDTFYGDRFAAVPQIRSQPPAARGSLDHDLLP